MTISDEYQQQKKVVNPSISRFDAGHHSTDNEE